MFWEWFLGIIGGLSVVAIACLLCYRYGKNTGIKIGADNLLSLFLKSGYDQKVKAFKIQNKFVKKGGIVFVGDSITQDYPIHDFYHNLSVYNRGIGGDTSEGLLKRLDESIFDLEPKTVVLLIGTNDLALLKTTDVIIANNISLIIQKIHEKLPNTLILLQSIYPINSTIDPFSVSARHNDDIRKVNLLLKDVKNVTYIDLDQDLSDEQGNLAKDLTVEGLHINANGYEVITRKIMPYLIKDKE